MSDEQNCVELINQQYKDYVVKLYSDFPVIKFADIEVIFENSGNCYYDILNDKILYPLLDGDIEFIINDSNSKSNSISAWKSCLIHEMIHEFEYKIVKKESELLLYYKKEAEKYLQSHKNKFSPAEKHGLDFYTSVSYFSKKIFNSTIELIINDI